MFDLTEAERARVAEIIRGHLMRREGIRLLDTAGILVDFGYDRESVWLVVEGKTAARLDWMYWWDRGARSVDEHASLVVDRLVMAWQEDAPAGGP